MSTKTKKPAGKASRSAIQDVVAREYTIHMHKRVRFDPAKPNESQDAPSRGAGRVYGRGWTENERKSLR